MRMYDHHEKCEVKTQAHLYKIGMFAQMNRVTVKALRFYEEQELLFPAYVDKENGYRYYTLDQMAVVHQITALKQAGFTLDDIKRINHGGDEDNLLQRKKAQLLAKISELTHQLAVIDAYLCDKDETLSAPVLIKRLPSVVVAYMQKRIDSYDELFTIMPEMGNEMGKSACECAFPEYCFTYYLEPFYKEKDILVEICESVTEEQEDTEVLKFKKIPGVKAACIFHRGSYDRLSESYARILKYIEDNDYTICGNIRESYIDGVWNKDHAEQWLTEIQIPVKGPDKKDY